MSSEILDTKSVYRSLTRITHEITEKNKGVDNIALIGIKRRGVSIANILRENIKAFEGVDVPFGELDITFYRDDLTKADIIPRLKETNIGFDVSGKDVILVDDVIYTGRTVRAAIEAVFASGRPSSIQLAVLIDRGHRELPIKPDYVGKNVPTSSDEIISVCTDDFDGKTCVNISKLH